MKPPTLLSRTCLRKARYSRVRELGAAPWNGMKMSCATSSRRVMVFIQRRTVADALIAEAAAFGVEDGLAAAPRRAGADIAATANSSDTAIGRAVGATTLFSVPDFSRLPRGLAGADWAARPEACAARDSPGA